MDPVYCEDLRGRLSGLLILPGGRMEKQDAALIHQFIAAGEYGLALEELAGFLALAGIPVTGQERGGMLALALAQRMQMDDNVPPHWLLAAADNRPGAGPNGRLRPPENGGCRA